MEVLTQDDIMNIVLKFHTPDDVVNFLRVNRFFNMIYKTFDLEDMFFYKMKFGDVDEQLTRCFDLHFRMNGYVKVNDDVYKFDGSNWKKLKKSKDRSYMVSFMERYKKFVMINIIQIRYINIFNRLMKNDFTKRLIYQYEMNVKFDSKYELIGFTNGVIDSRNKVFREVRLSDYITYNTNIEFKKPSDDDLNALNKWLFDLCLNEEEVNNFIGTIADCLIKNARLLVLCIGNGVTLKAVMGLIEYCFNDYFTYIEDLCCKDRHRLNADIYTRNIFTNAIVFEKLSSRFLMACAGDDIMAINHNYKIYNRNFNIWLPLIENDMEGYNGILGRDVLRVLRVKPFLTNIPLKQLAPALVWRVVDYIFKK